MTDTVRYFIACTESEHISPSQAKLQSDPVRWWWYSSPICSNEGSASRLFSANLGYAYWRKRGETYLWSTCTTGLLPMKRAERVWMAGISSGKLKGVMIATGPNGHLTPWLIWPAWSPAWLKPLAIKRTCKRLLLHSNQILWSVWKRVFRRTAQDNSRDVMQQMRVFRTVKWRDLSCNVSTVIQSIRIIDILTFAGDLADTLSSLNRL